MKLYPQTQSELIKAARGKETQAAFAKKVGCDRSCLSRYENEVLGAPTSVINYCLARVATSGIRLTAKSTTASDALISARNTVEVLERLAESQARLQITQSKRGVK